MRNNLREAQMIMLDLLIEFDRICLKYNLVYWLDFGTLLGAVRDHKFIHWDDDLDVAMPREDYNKFLKIAQNELKSSCFLQNKETDSEFFLHFTKIRDRNSTYIEKHEVERTISYHQGIYIDIFPVNYIKETKASKIAYNFFKNTIKFVSNRYIAIDLIARPLVVFINTFHHNDNSFVVRGAEMMTNKLQLNQKEIFPLAKIEFEGHNFSIPKNFNLYLTLLYGNNYMLLPPIEKRKSHHAYISIEDICDYEARVRKESVCV